MGEMGSPILSNSQSCCGCCHPLQAEASFSDSATDANKFSFFGGEELEAPLQMDISILL